MSNQEGLSRRPVYMDHHATTPVDLRVLEAMTPYFTQCFGNAASIEHEYGAAAGQAVDRARRQAAEIINAHADEIIFTSGATEANNLAILGAAAQYSERGRHIITCVTEHKAVLDTCHHLEERGWRITYLPVDSHGMIDPDEVRHAITPDTILVSVMVANNEIGTIAPIADIGHITREREVIFHTDATQAVGHIPVDVEAMNIDMLSMSAHKLYGPQGVGALYVRRRRPRVRLTPILFGGGHERGMRSGTMNLPGIVGLGKAVEIAGKEMGSETHRLRELRDRLWANLKTGIESIELNEHPNERLPHNLSIAIPSVESRSLLVQLKHDVAISTGSACTSAKVEPSHVILALGHGAERAHCSLRFGLGRENNKVDVDFVSQQLTAAVKRLRHLVLL